MQSTPLHVPWPHHATTVHATMLVVVAAHTSSSLRSSAFCVVCALRETMAKRNVLVAE